MKNSIKKSLILTLAATSLSLTACNSGGSNFTSQGNVGSSATNSALSASNKSLDNTFIRAAYIDVTAQAAFDKIQDKGFQTPNVLILGFADINSSTLNGQMQKNVEKAINTSNYSAVNLLSIGGEKANTTMNVDNVFNNVSSQIDNYNRSHDRKIDGVDLDLENGINANTIKQLAQKFKARGYIVTGAPQIYTSGGDINSSAPKNMILTSGGGTGNTYQAAISAGLFDAVLVQTYNTNGFAIDGTSEDKEKFYMNAAKALATISNQKECTSDTKICIPATTKVVVTTVANSAGAGNASNIFGFYPSGENQGVILSQLQADINSLTSTYGSVQYAGVAVWASTNDYDPVDYGNYSATTGAFTNTILTMNVNGRPNNPAPVVHVIPTPGPGEFLYPNGIGTYKDGTVVIDTDTGTKYQCKSGLSSWCNMPSFDPTGVNSSSAWDVYTGPQPKPVNPSDYPTYPEGISSYKEGTVVYSNGKYYQCKPFPNSGFCTQSTYAPGSTFSDQAWNQIDKPVGPTPSPTITPTPVPPSPTPTPAPAGPSINDTGEWNSSVTYTVNWSGPIFPVVSYEGQKWIACSDAAAGGKPGHGNWPEPWNPWVVYTGNPGQCS